MSAFALSNNNKWQQWTMPTALLAWSEGRRLPTIQSAFTKLTGELLQWL